jgi:hypothetical protein
VAHLPPGVLLTLLFPKILDFILINPDFKEMTGTTSKTIINPCTKGVLIISDLGSGVLSECYTPRLHLMFCPGINSNLRRINSLENMKWTWAREESSSLQDSSSLASY